MTNEVLLAARAKAHAHSLPKGANVFASTENVLTRERAVTTCSTFLTLLLHEVFDLSPVYWAGVFRSEWPRARDYAADAEAGLLPRKATIQEATPGCLFAIAYENEREGFSGHCGVVTGVVNLGENRWRLTVVDSCRSSHGPFDTRYRVGEELGGIGEGAMRIHTDDEGHVTGYQWSERFGSEIMRQGRGQSMFIAGIPPEWKPKENAHG